MFTPPLTASHCQSLADFVTSKFQVREQQKIFSKDPAWPCHPVELSGMQVAE